MNEFSFSFFLLFLSFSHFFLISSFQCLLLFLFSLSLLFSLHFYIYCFFLSFLSSFNPAFFLFSLSFFFYSEQVLSEKKKQDLLGSHILSIKTLPPEEILMIFSATCIWEGRIVKPLGIRLKPLPNSAAS